MSVAWLGIDLGGTKVAVVVVDEAGVVRASGRMPTPREGGPEVVLRTVVQLAQAVRAAAANDGAGRVVAVGLGFPGLVDVGAGRVTSSVILSGFSDFPLAQELERRLDLPATIDNDANCAGLADHLARGGDPHEVAVLFTVGTGIGGAIVAGGRLVRGRSGVAGEFGHMTIDLDGDICWCGARGCLHTRAAGSAIAERAWNFARQSREGPLAALKAPPKLEVVAAAAREGDPSALRAITDGARALGAGVAAVVQALNPHHVGLMGGVLGLGPDYLARVRSEVEARTFPESRVGLVIEATELGPDAGAIGAAGLARTELVR